MLQSLSALCTPGKGLEVSDSHIALRCVLHRSTSASSLVEILRHVLSFKLQGKRKYIVRILLFM